MECRTLHFSAQAKPAHAESVIFVYGKQTCSGSPLYICFVQINYARKQKTGQPFLSCPVLFSGLKQQFHAVFRLRTTVLADTVMLRQ